MADRTDAGTWKERVSRRGLLGRLARAGAVGAGAAVIGGGVLADPALAGTDGDVVLGVAAQVTSGATGIYTSGPAGLIGQTTAVNGAGLHGVGSDPSGTGVLGESESIGVYGRNWGSTGIGVKGETGGTGAAVYGLANLNGVGVYGDAPANGTGVVAKGTTGKALVVNGKAQFSRSGTATIVGTLALPKASIVVPGVALTTKSLILVTAQKNVAGVWVRAAVPNVAASSIAIFLNTTVTTSMPVAWMVIEKP